jgi:crossover junction endodeoxyribonuclease RusA
MAMTAPRTDPQVRFALPYPPTVNTYWRNIGKGRTILSAKARAYRAAADAAIAHQGDGRPAMLGRIAVAIVVHPPDRRRRDLDNILKPLLDALANGHVIVDDSLIDRLQVERGEVIEDGMVLVSVEPCNAVE